MATRTRVLVAAAFAITVALLATACGDSATTENSAQQSDIQALQDRIQRNEMLYSNLQLQGLPLHDLNETLVNDGKVESNFLPTTRSVIRIVGLTNWNGTLQPDATKLQDHAIELIHVLESGDIEAAKTASTDMHEQWHQFTVKVWSEIGADIPPEAGTSKDSHDATTPGAEATPALDDH
ncbi:MAG: hypothetical protein HY873_06735 [Chloroflexi bacterium]|nr:hypothetical protein [Chloroflexota bacterium]